MRFGWLTALSLVVPVLVCVSVAHAQWETVFQAGAPGRAWPVDGVGSGPEVDFVQEAGTNPPPGDPNSPAVNQQADDDYYFAGEYPAPIGTVANDEIAFERAFAGTDNDLRIHFNLPDTLDAGDRFRFSYEPFNLDEGNGADPRYGVEVLFNDTLIFEEQVIRPADLSTIFTSPEFTAADVGAIGGPGGDNVISLRGINYNAEGGGNWMGLDYHHLEVTPIPEPTGISLLMGGLILLIPILWNEKSDVA